MGNLPPASPRLAGWRRTIGRLVHLPHSLYQLWRLPRLRPGDYYIDCGDHAVVCTESQLVSASGSWLGPWDYDLASVSLQDGSSPRSCSARHCAPRRVTLEFATLWVATESQRVAALENMHQIYARSPQLRQLWS